MVMGSGGGALDGRANPSRTRYGGSLDEEQNPTPNEMIKYGCVPLVLSYSQTCAHGQAEGEKDSDFLGGEHGFRQRERSHGRSAAALLVSAYHYALYKVVCSAVVPWLKDHGYIGRNITIKF